MDAATQTAADNLYAAIKAYAATKNKSLQNANISLNVVQQPTQQVAVNIGLGFQTVSPTTNDGENFAYVTAV